MCRAMSTMEFKVSLPDSLSEDEARLLLAIKLYELSKATLGEAAVVAGCSKRSFMEALGRLQIPVFNQTPGELRAELGT